MYQYLTSVLLLLCTCLTVHGKVRLHHMVGDNMILQQLSDARLWGWADPGKTVKVTVSWSDKKYQTVADEQGKWMVKVATPAAS